MPACSLTIIRAHLRAVKVIHRRRELNNLWSGTRGPTYVEIYESWDERATEIEIDDKFTIMVAELIREAVSAIPTRMYDHTKHIEISVYFRRGTSKFLFPFEIQNHDRREIEKERHFEAILSTFKSNKSDQQTNINLRLEGNCVSFLKKSSRSLRRAIEPITLGLTVDDSVAVTSIYKPRNVHSTSASRLRYGDSFVTRVAWRARASGRTWKAENEGKIEERRRNTCGRVQNSARRCLNVRK